MVMETFFFFPQYTIYSKSYKCHLVFTPNRYLNVVDLQEVQNKRNLISNNKNESPQAEDATETERCY